VVREKGVVEGGARARSPEETADTVSPRRFSSEDVRFDGAWFGEAGAFTEHSHSGARPVDSANEPAVPKWPTLARRAATGQQPQAARVETQHARIFPGNPDASAPLGTPSAIAARAIAGIQRVRRTRDIGASEEFKTWTRRTYLLYLTRCAAGGKTSRKGAPLVLAV
jgi:hypothetical protein